MSDHENEDVKAERERCMRIVSAARNGDIDTDFRTILHFIRCGDQMLLAPNGYQYLPDYERQKERPHD
jgi:hypothetical protein